MNPNNKRPRKNAPQRNANDVVVSFQAPRKLVEKVKALAKKEDRSFGSLLRRTITNLVESESETKGQ